MRCLAASDELTSGQLLLDLMRAAPDHPQVLRWCGMRHFKAGEWAAAVSCLERAARLRPGDFAVFMLLATAKDHAGDFRAAPLSLHAATRCAKSAEE